MEEQNSSLRELNMGKRRDRILHEARGLITRGGYAKLNLRALASASEVTVPTIYNLVGNKEALIVALLDDALAEIEKRIVSYGDGTPLEQAVAAVSESIALFEQDEDYYRAAFIAIDYLDQSPLHHAAVEQLYHRGAMMIALGFEACRAAGLLKGKIPPPLLAAQIVRSYRTLCRAWAFGQASIEEFRHAALSDVYTGLAADAVETFHATLIKMLAAQGVAARPTIPVQAKRGQGVKR